MCTNKSQQVCKCSSELFGCCVWILNYTVSIATQYQSQRRTIVNLTSKAQTYEELDMMENILPHTQCWIVGSLHTTLFRESSKYTIIFRAMSPLSVKMRGRQRCTLLRFIRVIIILVLFTFQIRFVSPSEIDVEGTDDYKAAALLQQWSDIRWDITSFNYSIIHQLYNMILAIETIVIETITFLKLQSQVESFLQENITEKKLRY